MRKAPADAREIEELHAQLENLRSIWKVTDGVTLATLVQAARRNDGTGPSSSTISRTLAGKMKTVSLSGRQMSDMKRVIMAQRKRNRQGTGAAGR